MVQWFQDAAEDRRTRLREQQQRQEKPAQELEAKPTETSVATS